ncbi:hypothetical protein Pmar_PMAR027400 [Perkinsus marinus ATCC 50983]|uniref:Uncharacterized protein n=1 Tax=Perkinsus marinus (strain ATCC 50983 / TXsc) TaxID=423536 RepID=C5KSG8_PERM5|nr:hypothetical protein Pmar_PMAR027400 [Perkinsus marinus ATCC 50983]EER12582.1 hypothetical protein Pmar_PMAR027400 [Perkinsus marinus ATCC 50983]|eukprot:XP_002780787.1 hypothetical protein Pmar_PMAR027400 [Perkinsus marinus ATCC 50983]
MLWRLQCNQWLPVAEKTLSNTEASCNDMIVFGISKGDVVVFYPKNYNAYCIIAPADPSKEYTGVTFNQDSNVLYVTEKATGQIARFIGQGGVWTPIAPSTYAIAKSEYHSNDLHLKACERVLAVNNVDPQTMTKLIWASDVVGSKALQGLWHLPFTIAPSSERLIASMVIFPSCQAPRPFEMNHFVPVDLKTALLHGTVQALSLVLWSTSVKGCVLEYDTLVEAVGRIRALRPFDSQSRVTGLLRSRHIIGMRACGFTAKAVSDCFDDNC